MLMTKRRRRLSHHLNIGILLLMAAAMLILVTFGEEYSINPTLATEVSNYETDHYE